MPLNQLFQFLYTRYFNLTTGNKVLSANTALRAIKGNHTQVMANTFIDMHCSIGDYSYIGYNCFITASTIGRYVSIANNVTIGPGEHDISAISTSSLFYKQSFATLTKEKCIIGNDVWIGVDSIVRRGVVVGNGVIIGANSFVNTDIPDFAIVAGSPAKIIKYRFNQQIINFINQSNWWEYDEGEARVIIDRLSFALGKSLKS